MSATIRLRSGDAEAEIALRGAELMAWRVGDTPLIWTPDPLVWADTAPLLFPVVGWTRGGTVRVRDVSYPLSLHGFARHLPFEPVIVGPDHVRLMLLPTVETMALYPFAFSFAVDYRLDGASLRTDLSIGNTGATAMPYACGLHPGFCWPFAGGALDDYDVLFEADESGTVPVISPAGLFTRARRTVPLAGRRLALTADLFAREALCFLEARSRRLRFAHRGGAALAIALDGFPHIALWSRPGGRFLSIEAWTGHGDYDDSDGDLMTKPSMIHLAPGAVGRHAATLAFEASTRG